MHLTILPTAVVVLLLSLPHASASTIVSTVVITATSPSTPTATSPSYTSDSDFQNAMLATTNFYRNEHNVSDLTWNDTSAKYAANWAGACNFKHSGGPTGENLAAGYANASASVDAWGLEREQYDYNKPGFSEATGHFTQLVWSNTTSVGCGRASCQGSNNTPGWYVVCEYYPAGNVVGDNNQYFADNVKKQTKGKPTDTVESGVTSSGTGSKDLRWGVGVLGVAALVGGAMGW